jgi:hypothetical protein
MGGLSGGDFSCPATLMLLLRRTRRQVARSRKGDFVLAISFMIRTPLTFES